jgi:hypothetical protein
MLKPITLSAATDAKTVLTLTPWVAQNLIQ